MEELGDLNGLVVDFGCGGGASTYCLAREFPNAHFLGIDINKEAISLAQQKKTETGLKNISFESGDIYQPPPVKNVKGIICLQTLSWLPDYRESLQNLIEQDQPDFLSVSSLFYDGDISYNIKVTENTINQNRYYNIYSIPDVERFLLGRGYSIKKVKKFDIDIDLQTANRDLMSTSTVKASPEFQEIFGLSRIQISGALFMPWYFLVIQKMRHS